MSAIHSIRLRGPWGCQALVRYHIDDEGRQEERMSDLPPAGRLKMPADWSAVCGDDFRGVARLRRRFHWPTRLMPRERVWLVFQAVCGTASVRLNDSEIGCFGPADAPWEVDVTEQLEATNVLLVDVASSGPAPAANDSEGGAVGGLTGEVRLEVRRAR